MIGNVSIFHPSSSLALPVAHLFVIVGIVMAAILGLVTALVLYICVRFRRRMDGFEPRQNYGHTSLEIAWTVVPLLVLFFIFVASLRAMRQSDPVNSPEQLPDLVVIGHQWWWEVRYMHPDFTAANEVHIPVGNRWLVRLESADVIHDWWVAPLGPKMDAIPGHPNFFWLEADSPGHYLGTCAEYCGAEHAGMRILVVAEPQNEFAKWSAHQLERPAAAPLNADAARGAQLFRQLTCSSCHGIAGISANPHVGPDLTHVASRETLASGVIRNTPQNLAKWLSNPQSVKPESNMPDFQLNRRQVSELAAYLETLQ